MLAFVLTRRFVALPLALVLAACGARTTLPGGGADREARPADCGDHVVDPAEACDDGNAVDGDACTNTCAIARCGDGVPFLGVEGCDDGNSDDEDDCGSDCSLPSCGNGVVDAGEDCDDANEDDTDACPSRCLFAKCGDGFVRTGVEACDLGPLNADSPALVLTQGSLQRAVLPVDRAASDVAFYGYASASSQMGIEQVSASRVFLYRDLGTGALSLFLNHGIDLQSSGIAQPPAKIRMDLVGLPESAYVSVTDDKPEEFFRDSDTSAVGDWTFDQNSDGGVLSGLPFPGNFSIELTPDFRKGMDDWSYIDADLERVALVLTEPANLSAFDTPSACRLDCTIPRCGDGILDAGEVCDDGNEGGGDGCAADCRSLP